MDQQKEKFVDCLTSPPLEGALHAPKYPLLQSVDIGTGCDYLVAQASTDPRWRLVGATSV
jgi:hypothetical protein